MDETELIQRGKPEKELIERYWKWKGGTLVREYEMVKKDKEARVQFRRLDAIIILNGNHKEITREDFKDRGLGEKDEVEFIQAKALPLGMSLMGQTLFSRGLMNKKMWKNDWNPRKRRWIALCKEGDTELGELMRDYGIDVVIPKGNEFVVDN